MKILLYCFLFSLQLISSNCFSMQFYLHHLSLIWNFFLFGLILSIFSGFDPSEIFFNKSKCFTYNSIIIKKYLIQHQYLSEYAVLGGEGIIWLIITSTILIINRKKYFSFALFFYIINISIDSWIVFCFYLLYQFHYNPLFYITPVTLRYIFLDKIFYFKYPAKYVYYFKVTDCLM